MYNQINVNIFRSISFCILFPVAVKGVSSWHYQKRVLVLHTKHLLTFLRFNLIHITLRALVSVFPVNHLLHDRAHSSNIKALFTRAWDLPLLLLTFSGRNWGPVQTYLFEDLPPSHRY